MTTIDYSVWDHIEVSDDEDDTHPNIDTPSLFRWRHQARVERMEAFTQKGVELEKSLMESRRRLAEAQRRVQELSSSSSSTELSRAQAEEKQLKKEERSLQRKMEEHRAEEKKMPWNVDTLSREGFSKEAKLHMKRCIDSGLWVPNARADEDGDKEEAQYEELQKEEQ